MRIIGHLDNESTARVFSDYLFAQDIDNQIELERNGTWALWIHAEEQIETAGRLLFDFRKNPNDLKYQRAVQLAGEKREQQRKRDAAAQKKSFDRNRLFPSGGSGVGVLTLVLIGISVMTALASSFGDHPRSILWMYISRYDVDGGALARLSGLPEIRHGELWRLFTPMFVHFGIPHILFNMLWLFDLGTMIERRQGTRLLAALVLVIAALSNAGQYLVSGPLFGGMSGVVYGLIGYIWLRGRFDPSSGLFLHPNTVIMSVVWFFLCLFHVIPNVANTVHGVGFGVGIVWGYVSALMATRNTRR